MDDDEIAKLYGSPQRERCLSPSPLSSLTLAPWSPSSVKCHPHHMTPVDHRAFAKYVIKNDQTAVVEEDEVDFVEETSDMETDNIGNTEVDQVDVQATVTDDIDMDQITEKTTNTFKCDDCVKTFVYNKD